MNIRWMYFTIATLVVFLFTGNYAIVRSATDFDCDRALKDCECRVELTNDRYSLKALNKSPSCSVDDWFGGDLKTCTIIKVGSHIIDVVKCNLGKQVVLTCGPKGARQTVSGGKSLNLKCDSGSSSVKTTNKKGDWVNLGSSQNPSIFKSAWNKIARFAGAEDEIRHTMIAETERITVIDGDAGFLTENAQPLVMLTAGEAIVESFCDGSITRFKAPAIVKMPKYVGNIDPSTGLPLGFTFQPCVPNDLAGRWYGLYHRVYPGLSAEDVPVSIDLRQEPGTLETPDGIFDIRQFSASSGRLKLIAEARTGTGRLNFEGNFDKGGMYFDYTEENVGKPANSTRYGSGSAQRLHIAQWAISGAALDSPYRHALLALSPADGDLTWSVTSGKLPNGLFLDGASGVLSGTPAAEGSFEFTVEVRDANGDSFRQPLTLVVGKMVLATPLLPQAFPNQEYRFKLEMSGGTPPYRYTNLFAIPFPIPGLPPMPRISSDGEITFTPAKSDGSMYVQVADASGSSLDIVLAIEVRKLMIMGSAFLPSAVAGKPFNFKLETAGQNGTVTWEAEPERLSGAGLSLDSKTGELSGTPEARGVYTIQVTATDESTRVTRELTVTVDPPA